MYTGIRFDIGYQGHIFHFEIAPNEAEAHHLGAVFQEPVLELYYSMDDYSIKEFCFGIPCDEDDFVIDPEIFTDYIETYIDSMLEEYTTLIGIIEY